eukprot:6175342-Pleurochrysis_carterae.AAC.7
MPRGLRRCCCSGCDGGSSPTALSLSEADPGSDMAADVGAARGGEDAGALPSLTSAPPVWHPRLRLSPRIRTCLPCTKA